LKGRAREKSGLNIKGLPKDGNALAEPGEKKKSTLELAKKLLVIEGKKVYVV